MDGPAFYNARKGIEELKKSDFLFRIESKEPPGLDLSNNVLSLLSHISTNWGENRFLILTSLLQDKPVSGIARKLGMSRVGVYKNINAGALNIIVDLIRQIEHEMDLAVSECR
jgi:hypothetical protein